MGKNKTVEWGNIIKQAVKVSGEKEVLSTVSKRCGTFNQISDLQEYITERLSPEDRSTRGWLANSLKKLGKEAKGNKYAQFSKVDTELAY